MNETHVGPWSCFQDSFHPRFTSLEVHASGWREEEVLNRCARRSIDRTKHRAVAPAEVYEFPSPSNAGSVGDFTWSVWWKPPSCWRDEYAVHSAPADVSLVTDTHALVFVAAQKTIYSNAAALYPELVASPAPVGIFERPTIAAHRKLFPLLGVFFPPAEWHVEQYDAVRSEGSNSVVQLHAKRRAGVYLNRSEDPAGYWLGVDEYECLFDKSCSMMLQVTAIDGGRPIAKVKVDEMKIDQPLPTAVFSYMPESGTGLVEVVWSNSHQV